MEPNLWSFAMSFPSPSLILLFVSNPLESATFYSHLFGIEPVEKSETFALFAFPNSIKLGLWSPRTAEPATSVIPGGSEVCFEDDHLDAIYNQWLNLGVKIIQPPTEMDFGRTFTGLDPDGHRLRVYRLRSE